MPSPILETIAQDIQAVDGLVAEAEELISAAKEAGEDTKEQEVAMMLLKVRKAKWQRMLQARGL